MHGPGRSLTLALQRSVPWPGHFIPGTEIKFSWYRRLVGPKGWSGQIQKITHSAGFKSQTVKPVASS